MINPTKGTIDPTYMNGRVENESIQAETILLGLQNNL